MILRLQSITTVFLLRPRKELKGLPGVDVALATWEARCWWVVRQGAGLAAIGPRATDAGIHPTRIYLPSRFLTSAPSSPGSLAQGWCPGVTSSLGPVLPRTPADRGPFSRRDTYTPSSCRLPSRSLDWGHPLQRRRSQKGRDPAGGFGKCADRGRPTRRYRCRCRCPFKQACPHPPPAAHAQSVR
jgi:hypothetical protein